MYRDGANTLTSLNMQKGSKFSNTAVLYKWNSTLKGYTTHHYIHKIATSPSSVGQTYNTICTIPNSFLRSESTT